MKKSVFVVFGSVYLLGLFELTPCRADVAIVVNPANANAVTADQTAQIFLGKAKKFADGSTATPINQKEGSAVDVFNQSVVKKSASQLKAYWSEIVFTGKGTAPKEMASDAEVKATVAKDKTAIGYIDAGAVDASVKAVLKVP